MPTIFADANDGLVQQFNQSTFVAARDATAGNSVLTTNSFLTANCYARNPARGGGVRYNIARIFLYFDTTSITVTPASATFSIQRTTLVPNTNFRLVKSTAFGGDGQTALSTADFDAFPGFSAGSSMASNVTEYTNSTILFTAWGTSNAYNTTTINLNSTALSDMASNDFLIFAMVDFDFDYKNVDSAPINLTRRFQFYTANFTGRQPKIDYVSGAAGYGKDVIGVTSSDIVDVSGVATADIVDVIGVS